MKRLAFLTSIAVLATACSETPADIPMEEPGSYGASSSSQYVDLGHQPPGSFSSMLGRAPSAKPGSNAVLNGSFEDNAGPGSTAFAEWGTYNEGDGAVFAQTGTSSPLTGFPVPAPPEGDFAAMTDQFGPGLHILYQDVTVPEGATLGFDLYIGNRAGDFFSPPTLSPGEFPNQQFRADVMDPAAPIDHVGGGVLVNAYQTQPGDPPESGYTRVVVDLSAWAGETVRIRFAQVDNLGNFNAGVDNVVVGDEPKGGGGQPGGPAEYLINGFGHIGSGNTIRTFSFSARRDADGTATGNFELFSREAGVRIHGIVTCATVFGSTAWIGGTITTEGPYQGRDAIFRAADLGAGTKGAEEDRLSLLQPRAPGQAQLFCDQAPPFPGLDFGAQGNITISSPGEASFTEIDFVELEDFGVFIPCALDGAGEVVFLQGSLMNVFHFTEDQAGGFNVRSSANPQDVSGYGATSGDLYQGTGNGSSHDHFTISGVPYIGSFINNFRIIGQGSGNNLMIHENGQFTVNANGDLTVSNVNFSASCS